MWSLILLTFAANTLVDTQHIQQPYKTEAICKSAGKRYTEVFMHHVPNELMTFSCIKTPVRKSRHDNRDCVRKEWKLGNETLGASGTYCIKG